ncbi:MAG TPA: aspartate/glutamate racemase family protein, partial [Spongiibacteraceae bacterium]|nr:aspartate/glutamate racemase family protein [Spongiibacteraceae bacterium]
MLTGVASAPIGVFDSGIGGLSVLQHLRAALPAENFLYVADSAHAPYGARSPQAICKRAFVIADFLIERGAKLLVVACNTATAAAVAELRARYTLPVV